MLEADDVVLDTGPLGFPWPTLDPFLFCVHHLDAYPQGNERLGPAASLEGRHLGMDFELKDGWRMYHGQSVPGFPQHPHRGFETVTIARQGFIDHSDSLGATARFGEGDVQWMTAGRGIVHSEMFPLLRRDAPNTCELFQIWLNLPARNKLIDPYFTMLWAESIPTMEHRDDAGRTTHARVVAGRLGDAVGPPPSPHSWAADPENDVAIWTLVMEPHATFDLPPSAPGSTRALYFFRGSSLTVGSRRLTSHCVAALRDGARARLTNGDSTTEVLVLGGRPVNEPVAHHGPFVMNTAEEIREAYQAYRRTRFGGWPWSTDDPVHARERGRFALHADGRIEERATRR